MATEVWADGKSHKVSRAGDGQFGHGPGKPRVGFAEKLSAQVEAHGLPGMSAPKKAPAKKAAPRASGAKATPAMHVSALRAAGSRADAEKYADGLKGEDLKATVREAGLKGMSGKKVGDVRAALVEHFHGTADLRAAQDARIRAATSERVKADLAETHRQQKIAVGGPDGGPASSGKQHLRTDGSIGRISREDAAVAMFGTAGAAKKIAKAAEKAPAKRLAKAAPDATKVGADLKAMDSREAARTYLDDLKLTAPQLKELAAGLGVTLPSRARVGDAKDAIVQRYVGSRLASDAVSRSGGRPKVDRSPDVATAPAKTKAMVGRTQHGTIPARRADDPDRRLFEADAEVRTNAELDARAVGEQLSFPDGLAKWQKVAMVRDAADRNRKVRGVQLDSEHASRVAAPFTAQQQAIVDAVRDLQTGPSGWVGLADLRNRLDAAGMTRAEQDRLLQELAIRGGVRVIPIANSKALRDRDRAAALRMGGQDLHAIQVDPKAGGSPSASVDPAERIKSGDFRDLRPIGGALGSNEGGVYQAPDGSRWYVKAQKSVEHANNEAAAAALYRAAGVDTPEVSRASRGKGAPGLPDGAQTATRWIDGSETDLFHRVDANDREYLGKIRAGFAVDAWLGNWDVAGQGFDNIVSLGGDPHRIDAGGALLFRARGGPKGTAFGHSVTEWETFSDAKSDLASARTFRGITDQEKRDSAARVEAVSPEQIRSIVAAHGLPPKVADTLIARRADVLKRAASAQPATPTPTTPEPVRNPVDEARVKTIQSRLDELQAAATPIRAAQLEYTQKYRGGRFAPPDVEEARHQQNAEMQRLKEEAGPLADELLALLRERDGTNLGSVDDPDRSHWDQVRQDFEATSPWSWDRHVSIQPAPGATSAQTAAATKVIDKYREDDRTTVLNNEKIRADDPSVKAWERKIQAAIETTHLSQDSIVYRGAALPPQVLMQFRPGVVISDKGFNSTTSDREIAEGYTDTRSIFTPGVLPVVFEIRTRAGTPAADAKYSGEVVFGSGRAMRIISVSERPAGKYLPAGIEVVAEWL